MGATAAHDAIRYPDIEPYEAGALRMGSHDVHYNVVGNPEGVACVYVHGGPGMGSQPGYRRIFDPKRYKAVFIDQRGCGKSVPSVADTTAGALWQNSPSFLVGDMERVRNHLGIRQWHVFGDSWGCALALQYASVHTDKVASLTLGSVYMHQPSEIDHYINRMGRFRPQAWHAYMAELPDDIVDAEDKLPALYKAVIQGPAARRQGVSSALARFEAQCAMGAYTPPSSEPETAEDMRRYITTGILELFYMQKHAFEEGWYASSEVVKALARIPNVHMMNARHDIITPPHVAHDLQRTHPHFTLEMMEASGHMRQPIEMMQAWVRRADSLVHPHGLSLVPRS